MGRTAKNTLGERAGQRDVRIAKARARRLGLDKDREARDARIDAAVADAYLAQADRDDAAKVIAAADARMGDAIVRILTEGVPMTQVAQLIELSVAQARKLKAARTTHEATATAGESTDPDSAVAGKLARPDPAPAAEPGRPGQGAGDE